MPRTSALRLLLGAVGLWQVAESKGHFGFDCESGYAHWHAAWNAAKKDWCCNYVNRGCVGDKKGGEEVFDCSDGFIGQRWKRGWSDLKKDWCCKNAAQWSAQHQPFCCARHKGCSSERKEATTPKPKPYYCYDKAAWTDEKRDWCCSHEDQGCPLQHEKEEEERVAPQQGQEVPERPVQQGLEQGLPAANGLLQGGAAGQASAEGLPAANGLLQGGAAGQASAEGRPVGQPVAIVGQQDVAKAECEQGDRGLWTKEKTCGCCNQFGIACPPVYYPPDVPPVGTLICVFSRLYEADAGELSDTSKASSSLSKVAVGGVLGLLVSAIVLGVAVVRRGLRRGAGVRGYTVMPERQTGSVLAEAGVQESKALGEEFF